MSGLRYINRLGVISSKLLHWTNTSMKQVLVANGVPNCKFFATESKVSVSETSTKTSPIFEVIRRAGVDEETLNEAAAATPEILDLSPKMLESCFSELIHNGFTGTECLRMVALYPPLAKLKEGQISLAVERWRDAQFGDARLLSLLKSCPHFLCIDLSQIPRRIPLLKSFSSKKNVVSLLRNAPNVMFENWNEVLAKVNYIEDVMKIDRKNIINTYALNRSLGFLKTRHVFLQRCGLYSPPKPKADPNQPSKNPPLSVITDKNDEYFVTKVAKLTMEEYEVFKELYMRELEDEEEEWSSDSDSE